jgi:hypothetical protein
MSDSGGTSTLEAGNAYGLFDSRLQEVEQAHSFFTPESLAIAAATAIYAKAVLEALGKRSGEGVADLTKRVSDLIRVRRKARKGKPDEYIIGINEGQATQTTTIVVSHDTPDEARLALLDLDVTAEEVRGKTLRWNATAGAWVPEGRGSALPPIS